jgi:predicted phage terminase large subunit-like protein
VTVIERLPLHPDRMVAPIEPGHRNFMETICVGVDPDRDQSEETLALQGSFRAFLKASLPYIVPVDEIKWGFHLDAMADHLEAVSRGQIRNLIMVLPPRTLKSSTLCSWSAWEWIRDPRIRRLCTSYDYRLAERDNGVVRDLVKHPWFAERWGQRVALRKDSDAKGLFETTAGGRRLVTSIGARGTGEGGSRVECDDPHNALKAENETDRLRAVNWWMGTMSSRVNDQTSAKILTGQRVHQRDLIGSVIAQMVEASGEHYERLILPMEYDPKLVVPLADLRPRGQVGTTGSGHLIATQQDAFRHDAPALPTGTAQVVVPTNGSYAIDDGTLGGHRTAEGRPFIAYQVEPVEGASDDEDDTDEPYDPIGFEGARIARLDPDERPSALIPLETSIGFRDPRQTTGELLCPNQWPESEIRVRKIQLGPYRYSSQYQGAPTPSEGGQFKDKYWGRYEYTHLWHRGLRPKAIVVDSAYGEEDGDPTGCAVWGDLGGHLYCMYAVEFNLETPDLRQALRDLHAKWKVPFLIEAKANGKALSQDLRRGSDDGRLPALPVVPFNPDGLTKEARAYTVVPYIAGGLVHLPVDAPWVADFIAQHSAFPKGAHDDLVDTTAMAIIWLKLHTSEVRDLFGRPLPAPFGQGMRVAVNPSSKNGYWNHR